MPLWVAQVRRRAPVAVVASAQVPSLERSCLASTTRLLPLSHHSFPPVQQAMALPTILRDAYNQHHARSCICNSIQRGSCDAEDDPHNPHLVHSLSLRNKSIAWLIFWLPFSPLDTSHQIWTITLEIGVGELPSVGINLLEPLNERVHLWKRFCAP
jgi:hypothetical protein